MNLCLDKGNNDLKWADANARIHKFHDIFVYKIPDNGQIAAIPGALFKNLGNLFVFFPNFRPKKVTKFVSFLTNCIIINVVFLKIRSFVSISIKF